MPLHVPIACTFQMSYRGFITSPIVHDATANQVTLALEAIASIGNVIVTSSYASLNSTFIITFKPTLGYTQAHIEMFGDLPDIIVSSTDFPIDANAVTELTQGYSPFLATVTAETVAASACTAIHSMGIAGANGKFILKF
jgi:hypothetical protein